MIARSARLHGVNEEAVLRDAALILRGDRDCPDEDVLEFARSQNRALLTINRKHFVRLHQSNAVHTGIVVCSLDLNFSAQAQRINESLLAAGNLSGKLIRVNRQSN